MGCASLDPGPWIYSTAQAQMQVRGPLRIGLRQFELLRWRWGKERSPMPTACSGKQSSELLSLPTGRRTAHLRYEQQKSPHVASHCIAPRERERERAVDGGGPRPRPWRRRRRRREGQVMSGNGSAWPRLESSSHPQITSRPVVLSTYCVHTRPQSIAGLVRLRPTPVFAWPQSYRPRSAKAGPQTARPSAGHAVSLGNLPRHPGDWALAWALDQQLGF
jgi:hypothetical protein